jgi:hypothetical protein
LFFRWGCFILAAVYSSNEIAIEMIGWASTATFLFSIIVPNRLRLHQLGIFASITTGIYAYAHGATAIWVKWLIALFFHAYMIRRAYLGAGAKASASTPVELTEAATL